MLTHENDVLGLAKMWKTAKNIEVREVYTESSPEYRIEIIKDVSAAKNTVLANIYDGSKPPPELIEAQRVARIPAASVISGGVAVFAGVGTSLASVYLIRKLEARYGKLNVYEKAGTSFVISLPAIPATVLADIGFGELASKFNGTVSPKITLTPFSLGISFGAGVAASLPITPAVSSALTDVFDEFNVDPESSGAIAVHSLLVGALILAAVAAIPAGMGAAATLGAALGTGAFAAGGFYGAFELTRKAESRIAASGILEGESPDGTPSGFLAQEAEESPIATAALALGIWTLNPILIGIWAVDHFTEPAHIETEEIN